MGTNKLWKKVLIAVLMVIAILALYPPEEKLKPGLDLAGGTSLIYGIDTEGMDADEVRGIASRMVPILMRRIDPTGVTNIIIRPQGDTRIEIQLPLASKDTRVRRDNYQAAFDALEQGNINLATVIRALSLPTDERSQAFDRFATNDEQRQILTDLAVSFDARKQARELRDSLSVQMDELAEKLAELDITKRSLEFQAKRWAAMNSEELDSALTQFVKAGEEQEQLNEQQLEKKGLLEGYVSAYKNWVDTVDRLADTINTQYDNALSRINELNINVSALADMMETANRSEHLARLKESFPDRAEKIDAFASAYDSYTQVRGRLDDPEDLKRMLRGAGVLEFRILPTVADGSISADLASSYVSALETRGPKLASDATYQWCEIEDPQSFGASGAITGTFAEKAYVLASNKPTETMLHNQGGRNWKLNRAYPTSDQVGRRAIGFQIKCSSI